MSSCVRISCLDGFEPATYLVGMSTVLFVDGDGLGLTWLGAATFFCAHDVLTCS